MSGTVRHLRWAVSGYAALLLALLPVLWPAPFSAPVPVALRPLGSLAAAALPAAAFLGCARLRLGLRRRDQLALLALLFLVTAVMNDLHRTMVDEARYFSLYPSNTEWQFELHRKALALDPTAIPHGYRVLPHALLRWIETATGSFTKARAVYRLTFVFLLLVTVYVWGRQRFGHATALLGVVLLAAVWPVTIRFYAGQPADPMSHLSFALAMVLIDRRRALPLCLVLSAGVLAKESVAALAVYYAAFRRDGPGHAARSAAVLAAAAIPALAIRAAVASKLADAVSYRSVSGVGLEQVARNLADANGYVQLACSLGPFLPFFALAWSRCPRDLRLLVPYLLATILVSSLLFSWLREARNYVPILIPLAMVASAFVLDDPRLSPEATPRPPEEG